jgi:hypothetical protein
MKRTLAVALCLLGTSLFVGVSGTQSGAGIPPENAESTTSGILVELFTSEGCSSCPPADELLRRLDAQRIIANNQIIVLSEHVDYWDQTGWRDRFSSRAYTDRQAEYARRFGIAEPYTPQMVVDGRQQFVGNSAHSLEEALRTAASLPKTSVLIPAADIDGNELILKLKANALPPGRTRGDLFVAVAENSRETQVKGGENSGRELRHVAVLRALQKVGKVGQDGLAKDMTLHLPKEVDKSNLRVVAFVQEPGNGSVLGSAVRILSRTTANR